MGSRPWGIILSGGQARRMGGGDKGLQPFAAGTLLGEVVRRMKPQCTRMVLSANGDPARFAAFGLPVVPDHSEDVGAGPIAGILAGLDAVSALDPACEAAMVVPTDTPLLPSDLVARLQVARKVAQTPVAVARSAGRDHPTVALWALECRAILRQRLRQGGERRLSAIQAAVGRVSVDWPVEKIDPFGNANTPAELAALRPS